MSVALAALFCAFLFAGTLSAPAYNGNGYDNGYNSHNGYYNHGHYYPYTNHNGHRGYWNQNSGGTRIFISI